MSQPSRWKHAVAASLLGVAAAATTPTPAHAGPPAQEDSATSRKERREQNTARFSESSTVQALGGGSKAKDYAVEISLGFPWLRARGQVGIGKGWYGVADFETALGRRFWPAAGVGYTMGDLPHFRLSGEVMLGWLVQTTPELRKRGFAPMMRMRVASPWGRWVPYANLGMQPALLMDKTTTITASGEEVTWSGRPNLTLWATLGLGVAITEHIGLDVGIDAPWVDVPQLTIPGFHVGIFLGGW